MRHLSARELAGWLADERADRPLLLDVREHWEIARAALPGAVAIPMREIPAAIDTLPAGRPTVCVCHHGARSLQVAMFLEARGFADVLNLTGGIDAWSREVDPSVPTY